MQKTHHCYRAKKKLQAYYINLQRSLQIPLSGMCAPGA